MNKQAKLQALAEEIVATKTCSELKEQATNLVVGSGSVEAKIMFIGEAPGAKEDQTGLPFVGVSGRLLDEMLSSINLTRQQVYITNIVKYRPPKNRDPRPDEKAQFWPFLVRQIEIIEPQLLVPLGRHAAGQFVPNFVISNDHGQIFDFRTRQRNFKVMPIYHPAATIYNRKLRPDFAADFQKIKLFLD